MLRSASGQPPSGAQSSPLALPHLYSPRSHPWLLPGPARSAAKHAPWPPATRSSELTSHRFSNHNISGLEIAATISKRSELAISNRDKIALRHVQFPFLPAVFQHPMPSLEIGTHMQTLFAVTGRKHTTEVPPNRYTFRVIDFRLAHRYPANCILRITSNQSRLTLTGLARAAASIRIGFPFQALLKTT
jgi:hypothetical protein